MRSSQFTGVLGLPETHALAGITREDGMQEPLS